MLYSLRDLAAPNWDARGGLRRPAGTMRNLHCCKDKRQQLALPVELGDVTHFAVDSDGGVLFVAGSGLGVAAYRTADCEVRSDRRCDMLASRLRSCPDRHNEPPPPPPLSAAACPLPLFALPVPCSHPLRLL